EGFWGELSKTRSFGTSLWRLSSAIHGSAQFWKAHPKTLPIHLCWILQALWLVCGSRKIIASQYTYDSRTPRPNQASPQYPSTRPAGADGSGAQTQKPLGHHPALGCLWPGQYARGLAQGGLSGVSQNSRRQLSLGDYAHTSHHVQRGDGPAGAVAEAICHAVVRPGGGFSGGGVHRALHDYHGQRGGRSHSGDRRAGG